MQLFLDFGQRDFDATVCSVCGMVYAKGKEADEAAHKKFHRKHTSAITFPVRTWLNDLGQCKKN